MRADFRLLNEIVGPLIGACATVVICFPLHGGFMALFVAVFAVPWGLWRALKVSIGRRSPIQLFGPGIWLLALMAVFARHYTLHVETRSFMDDVAQRILEHKREFGEFPDTIDRVGVSMQELRRHGGFYFGGASPSLVYPVTWIVFDAYDFDFENSRWLYIAS